MRRLRSDLAKAPYPCGPGGRGDQTDAGWNLHKLRPLANTFQCYHAAPLDQVFCKQVQIGVDVTTLGCNPSPQRLFNHVAILSVPCCRASQGLTACFYAWNAETLHQKPLPTANLCFETLNLLRCSAAVNSAPVYSSYTIENICI